MARMPGNVDLLVMHANFLIEVHKDGQAAHAQIQAAQQAKPGILDSYNIYAAQQLSKKLRKGRLCAPVCRKEAGIAVHSSTSLQGYVLPAHHGC
jgi:hypothetical protein